MKTLAALALLLTAFIAGAAIGWVERDKVEPEQVANWIHNPEKGTVKGVCR